MKVKARGQKKRNARQIDETGDRTEETKLIKFKNDKGK